MRAFTLLAALAASLTATVAHAAPSATFLTFQGLCLAPDAHAPQILAKAEADGWMPGPVGFAQAQPFKDMTEFGVKARTDGGSQSFLIAGSGPIGEFNGLKVSADICVLAVKGLDGNALAAEIGGWVGVAPDAKRSHPGDVTYSFTEDARGRVAVVDPNDDEAKALVKSGKVHLVMVQYADDHVMVGYFTPRL